MLQFQPNNELVGDDVAQLQRQLQELGFYPHRMNQAGLQDPWQCQFDRRAQLSVSMLDSFVLPNLATRSDRCEVRMEKAPVLPTATPM